MLLSLLMWMRNTFAVVTILGLGAGMIYLGQHPPQTSLFRHVLPFLGLQTGLNSLLDLKVLFGVKSKSDAHTMKSLFWLPVAFWALLWIALSAALMGWTISRSLNASDRGIIHTLKYPDPARAAVAARKYDGAAVAARKTAALSD